LKVSHAGVALGLGLRLELLVMKHMHSGLLIINSIHNLIARHLL